MNPKQSDWAGPGFYVGGLVGYNDDGSVDSCSSTGTVAGDSYVGGLVGANGGTISNSYATGSVWGWENVGGLAGENDGDVTNCFWDIEASGFSSSEGGVGLTTGEMQTASTFLEAGWDFVGEMENGTENIWTICEVLDYPKLAWQFVIGDYNGDGHTDFMDFCIFGQRWLGTDSSFWCPGGGTDLTNDALVNWQDLMAFAENWLGQQ